MSLTEPRTRSGVRFLRRPLTSNFDRYATREDVILHVLEGAYDAEGADNIETRQAPGELGSSYGLGFVILESAAGK